MRALVALAFLLMTANSIAETACPKSTQSDGYYGAAMPGWYGTESLAVKLGAAGEWPTTRPGYLIGEKVLWRSSGFRPGMESHLNIEIKNVNGGPVTGKISRATNAYLGGTVDEHPTGEWFIMTGIDFPEPGCWEIFAEYLGQTLTFVVETVDADVDANVAQ